MGSAMSLSCSKRKATSQDVDSESCKRRKICSTNDAENCIFIPDESSWSLCANRVISVAAVALTKFRFQQDNQESNSSSLSLPSPATSVSRNWKHDVFPSFHGADVRRTFLSHIMESFRRKGIDTFIDNNIERSKSIGPELKEAIKGSKIAIVLLSRKYASSSWCLDELAEIMKCREMVGQIVMTIFYEVEPTDIKKQTGEFGKAFTKTCRGKTKEHVERWRKALEDVATIAGYHSQKDIIVPNLGVAQERLKDKKVFLVLDEVDHIRQLDALAKETRWFGPGSRIIITTEDVRVLNAHRIKHVYKVKFPSSDEAFQIFCMNAFGQKQPHEGFCKLAWEVMALAGNLPLGLKVLGSALRGMSKPEWERTLPKIKYCLDGEIKSIIKFSFDALCDEDKDLFLYIACFFNGIKLHKVEGVLAKKFLDVRQSLHVLVEKSLISINQSGLIETHTVLKQFGRETSRKQFVHGFAKPQFLVDARDICEVLNDDTIDSRRFIVRKNIKNGRIFMHTLLVQFGRETSRKQFVHHRYTKHQLLVGERDICEVLNDDTIDSRRFIGIHLDLYSSNSEEELNISEKALERMHDFQFVTIYQPERLQPERLQPERLQLALQDLIYQSPRIRSLKWYWYESLCLPSTFNPEFLVELYMSCSNLRKLWEGTKQLRNLKWMDLSYSEDLKELPNLSTATNLEELRLSNCSSLVELPSSIEKLISLQVLDLRSCSSLVELPSFGNATKLEILDLDYCWSLEKLPPSINANNLQELSLRNCSRVVELPLFIGTARNLNKLDISGCSSLVKLPSSIGDMTNLKEFDLSNCSNLVELPSSIGNLQKLFMLRMRGCSKLETLPTNINLISLRILDLTDCLQLKRFPEISTHIDSLFLIGTAIKEVPLSIMSWSPLAEFQISYFESLKEFLHAFDIITKLHLSKDIQEVAPWVKRMSRLRDLRLNNCNNLVSLPQLSDSLDYIYADNCKSLERLDCCFNNPEISLNFPNCFKLNQEARDLIMHTSTDGYAMLPGTQVPPCFNHRATSGDSLKIKLKESSLRTTLRFKACIMLVKVNEELMSYDQTEHMISMSVEHNECTPSYHFINPLLTEHIYTFELEVEEVTSTELVFEFTLDKESNWKIGECGILQRETRSLRRSSSPELSPESSRDCKSLIGAAIV